MGFTEQEITLLLNALLYFDNMVTNKVTKKEIEKVITKITITNIDADTNIVCTL